MFGFRAVSICQKRPCARWRFLSHRDEIWLKGCQFYKAAKVDKKWLHWNLVGEYETEEGIDAGSTAVKGNFLVSF